MKYQTIIMLVLAASALAHSNLVNLNASVAKSPSKKFLAKGDVQAETLTPPREPTAQELRVQAAVEELAGVANGVYNEGLALANQVFEDVSPHLLQRNKKTFENFAIFLSKAFAIRNVLPPNLPQPPQLATVTLAKTETVSTPQSDFEKQFEEYSMAFQSNQGGIDEKLLGEVMALLDSRKEEGLGLLTRLQTAVDVFAQKMKDEADNQELPKLADVSNLVAAERRKLAAVVTSPRDPKYWELPAAVNAGVAFERMVENLQVAVNKFLTETEPANTRFEGQLQNHVAWARTQLENAGTQVQSMRILSAVDEPLPGVVDAQAQLTEGVNDVVAEVEKEVNVVEAEVEAKVGDLEAEVRRRGEQAQSEFQTFVDGPLKAHVEQFLTENADRERDNYPFANALYKTTLDEVDAFQ